MIFSGATLEETDVQEVQIVDPMGIPVAVDTETIYYFD